MQMILFKLNRQYYLISADSVEEVIDAPPITHVPLAPDWIEGLINLRGTMLTVVSLAKRINVEEPKINRTILIMKQEKNRKGLLIEEVVEVLDIDIKTIQLPAAEKESSYKGVVAFSDKIASVIDIEQMIF